MQQDTVIFDLDGTLALIDHRRHIIKSKSHPCPECQHAKTGEKSLCNRCGGTGTITQKVSTADWKLFYAMCDQDTPNHWVIDLVKMYQQNHRVVILSGRSEEVREKTLQWLAQHEVPFDLLVMRPEGDTTPDEELKAGWCEEYNLTPNRVKCVFDDRDKVVAMWRNCGFNCAQVAVGNF